MALTILGFAFTAGFAQTPLQPPTTLMGKQMPTLRVEEWVTTAPNLQNKWLLVEFWATWCGYCQKLTPRLNTIQATLGEKLSIIAVSNEETNLLRDYVQNAGVKYPVGRIAKGIIATQWGINVPGVPHGILTDQTGKVIWTGTLPSEDDSLLDFLKRTIR